MKQSRVELPAAIAVTQFWIPEVDMDFSVAALQWAWEGSFLRSNVEPNVILLGVGAGYHLVEQIVSHLPLTQRCLQVLVCTTLPVNCWMVGNLDVPSSFFGSRGA